MAKKRTPAGAVVTAAPTSSGADHAGAAGRGRPRNAGAEAAILGATIELMADKGVEATTLAEVARRAGVARATVYLRWPSRSALIGAATRAAVGGEPMPMSGELATDMRRLPSFIASVLLGPAIPVVLPEVLRGLLSGDLTFDEVVPRRPEFAEEYAAGAAREGFDPDLDPSLPFYVALGCAMAYLMHHRRSMPEGMTQQVADVLVRGFRADGRRTKGRRAVARRRRQ